MSRRYFEGPLDPERLLADPNFRVPDLIGTVEGWRAWRVPVTLPPYGLAPKMYSVTAAQADYAWVPRKRMQADCPTCGDNVPGNTHTCGFYSARDLEHLMSQGYHHYTEHDGYTRVVGQVANWGKVIECTRGWRAQYAYPVSLYVPFECWRLLKPLSEAFGVPAKLMNTLREEL